MMVSFLELKKMSEPITFCRTKAGKGFKIVVDGEWFYTSLHELYKVLQDKTNACQFRTIEAENEA